MFHLCLTQLMNSIQFNLWPSEMGRPMYIRRVSKNGPHFLPITGFFVKKHVGKHGCADSPLYLRSGKGWEAIEIFRSLHLKACFSHHGNWSLSLNFCTSVVFCAHRWPSINREIVCYESYKWTNMQWDRGPNWHCVFEAENRSHHWLWTAKLPANQRPKL